MPRSLIKVYFYTTIQAAQAMGTSRQTVSRWIRGGKLSHEKFGRETLIPKWEIERLRYQQVFGEEDSNEGG